MIEQHASLSEKFLKKGFWLYLFSFIIAPIGYIIKIILSGELTVSEVGILYGIISLITLISSFNDLGMSESLNHFIPKYVTNKRYDKVKSILSYALFAQIFTSLLIALFFFFGADYISINYFKTDTAIESLKVFAFFIIGLNIIQTITVFFKSVQDTFNQKIVDFIRMFFVMLSVLYLYFGNHSSLLNYSYTWIIGLYIGLIFSLFILYKKYYKNYFKGEKILINKKLIKEISSYAIMVVVGASAGSILGQIDMQMIIYILGTNDAGYYTNYLSIIGIPFMIIGPIFGLLFPIFSELYSKKEYTKIKLIKEIFTKNFLLIGIMFNLFFFIFSEIIAYTLFGEKFINSGIILKYSILFLIFNFLLQINFNILAGIGKVKDRVKIIFIAIVINFIMNLLLIKSIGVEGAALATGIGWIIIYLLSEYFLGKKYKVNFDYLSIFKNLSIMGFSGYIIYKFGLNIFEGISRINSFFLLGLFFIIWLGIFIIINYNQFRIFILEIKKLKKGN